ASNQQTPSERSASITSIVSTGELEQLLDRAVVDQAPSLTDDCGISGHGGVPRLVSKRRVEVLKQRIAVIEECGALVSVEVVTQVSQTAWCRHKGEWGCQSRQKALTLFVLIRRQRKERRQR